MLTDTVRMLMRRWLLCLLVVVLAIAAGVGAFIVVKPLQESKAQVLMVPAVTQPGVAGVTNPLLNLGGSLAIVPSLVQVKVSDDTVAQALYNAGAKAKYKVEQNLTENAGPTLLVTTDDKSGAIAQQTLTAVITEINTQLAALQASQNTDSKLLIKTVTLTQSTHPLPVRKGQVQKAIMAAIGVLVIGLLLVLLLERRRPSGPVAEPKPAARKAEPADRDDSASGQGSGQGQNRTQAGRRTRNEPRRTGERRSGERAPAQSDEPVEPRPSRRAVRGDGRTEDGNRPGRRNPRDEDDSDSSILPGGMSDSSPDPARR